MIRNTNCLLSVDCPFTLFNKDFHFELIDNGLINSRAGIVAFATKNKELTKLVREKEKDQGRLFLFQKTTG